MKDLFDRIYKNKGPLGMWASQAEGYFVFPKLEGPISNRMKFKGKEVYKGEGIYGPFILYNDKFKSISYYLKNNNKKLEDIVIEDCKVILK